MTVLYPFRKLDWLIFWSVICIIVLAIQPLQASNDPDFYPELATSNIPEDLKKGANAVIRYFDTQVHIEKTNAMVVTESAALTVLNKRGAGWLVFYETYKEKTESISDIQIEIVNALGMVIKKVKPRDIEDMVDSDDIALISDRKAKFFGWETDQFPVTIKYSFKKESRNTLFLPIWFPIFTDRISLERSAYEIINDTHAHIEAKEMNLDGYDIKKTGDLKYEMSSVKRVIKEKFAPGLSRLVPHVFFRSNIFEYEGIPGAFKDWDSYGKWVYQALLEPKRTLNTAELLTDVRGKIPQGHDKREIVKNIYEYVQQNTRYIFVNLADGGLVPMESKDVHEKKYGDCKALTFYTQAILDAYGIPSSYVINEAGYDKESFMPEYCDAYQGNHIILMVPLESDTLWMDCTSGDAPFNFLGAFTDDRVVLAVDENGGQLVRTPKYGADLYKEVYTTEIVLNEDLSVSVNYDLTCHGLSMDQRMSYYKMGNDEKMERLRDEYDHLMNLKLSDLSHHMDKDKLEGTEHYSIQADQFAERAGDYLLIPQKFESISIPKLGKKKSRKYPVVFNRGYKEIFNDNYLVPEGYELNTIPEAIDLKSSYGNYQKKITATDKGYLVERSFELYEGEFSPEEYPKIKTFFNKIKKEELSKIALSKKEIRP